MKKLIKIFVLLILIVTFLIHALQAQSNPQKVSQYWPQYFKNLGADSGFAFGKSKQFNVSPAGVNYRWMVYDTTAPGFKYWNGTVWLNLLDQNNGRFQDTMFRRNDSIFFKIAGNTYDIGAFATSTSTIDSPGTVQQNTIWNDNSGALHKGNSTGSLNWYNARNYGVKGDGTTDDTDSLQALLYKIKRDGAFNATVYFPYTGHDYIIGGAQHTSDGLGNSVNNAQLYIPYTAWDDETHMGKIKFLGEIGPNMYADFADVPGVPEKGVIIRSTLLDTGCVIGEAYNGGQYGLWNFTQFEMENLTVRVRSKTGSTNISPTMKAADFTYQAYVSVLTSRFDTESTSFNSQLPDSTCVGLTLPKTGNFVFVDVRNVLIQNFFTGIRASENANVDQLFVVTCYNAIEVYQSTHSIYFNKVLISWCRNGVYVSGHCYFEFNQIDFERQLSAPWCLFNTDVYEPVQTDSRGLLHYYGLNDADIDVQVLSRGIQWMKTGVPIPKTIDVTDSLIVSGTPYFKNGAIINNLVGGAAGIYLKEANSLKWSLTSLAGTSYWYNEAASRPGITIDPSSNLSIYGNLTSSNGNLTFPTAGTATLGNTTAASLTTGGAFTTTLGLLSLKESTSLKYTMGTFGGGQFTLYNEASPSTLFGADASSNAFIEKTLQVGAASASAASAALQVTSTVKGFLPPRMSTTQRDAIASPAEGLIIYNLTTHKLNVFTGSVWEAVTSL